MNQKNIIIGLVALLGIFLLFFFVTRLEGWGIVGFFNDDKYEEMEEHMHDDDDHGHIDDDGHMHDEEGEHIHDEMVENMHGDDESSNTPTSADNAPEGSMHNLPVPEAVAAVRSEVADELGISEGVVIIMSAYEKEWPNSCLGLADADEMCAQALVFGYQVTVSAQGKERVFRTNADGSFLREEK